MRKWEKADKIEEFARGMIVSGIRGKKFPVPIPLTAIPLALRFGATKHAHPATLTQQEKIPHPMAGSIFKTRNPCKHWPKYVSESLLSSMFPGNVTKKLNFSQSHPGYPLRRVFVEGVTIYDARFWPRIDHTSRIVKHVNTQKLSSWLWKAWPGFMLILLGAVLARRAATTADGGFMLSRRYPPMSRGQAVFVCVISLTFGVAWIYCSFRRRAGNDTIEKPD